MIAKPQEYEQLCAIYECRHERGLQSARAWLYDRQARINSQWLSLAGDELLRLQGEGQLVARLIKMIDAAPAVQKIKEGANHD